MTKSATTKMLEQARRLSLSYVSPAEKAKPLTPKQKKAQEIYDIAKDVGGCQETSLMKLLDKLTGLPVSGCTTKTNNPENVLNGKPSGWLEKRPLLVLIRNSTGTAWVSLGDGSEAFYLSPDKSRIPVVVATGGNSYREASAEEINKFYRDLPKLALRYVAAALFSKQD